MSEKNNLSDTRVDVTVVVPAYNEARRLPNTLREIVSYFEPSNCSYEVIIVDDGSSDETSAIVLEQMAGNTALQLITHEVNVGKGGAVKTGALAATGDLVLFCDADGATPIAEFARLKRAIDCGSDIAIGSRAISSDEVQVKTHLHRVFIGRVFNRFANLLLVPGIADTQCGFKLFTRQAAKKIFALQVETGFIFDVELLFLARKLGYLIAEVAVNWADQPGSSVRLLSDPLRMFFAMFRIRVRNYQV